MISNNGEDQEIQIKLFKYKFMYFNMFIMHYKKV